MPRPCTVLLADDDKVQALQLSTQLRQRGFAVVAAYDATSAVMVAIKSPPDAIVLDIQMPGGTGRAVLARLKGSTKTMQVPVIVLSGLTDAGTIAEVMAMGASEYLAKPADVATLDAALRRALGWSPDAAVPGGDAAA